MRPHKRNLRARFRRGGKSLGMTLPLIINIVFAALVLVVIPGLLAWAIHTSRNEGSTPTRAVRRPMPRPSFPSPRLSRSRTPLRRRTPDTARR